jgi:hypothetical protein
VAWLDSSSGGPPDLCPKCGAYWDCGCKYEVTAPAIALDNGCDHDWVSTVGVGRDEDFEAALEVLMCRLCGLYKATFARPGSDEED